MTILGKVSAIYRIEDEVHDCCVVGRRRMVCLLCQVWGKATTDVFVWRSCHKKLGLALAKGRPLIGLEGTLHERSYRSSSRQRRVILSPSQVLESPRRCRIGCPLFRYHLTDAFGSAQEWVARARYEPEFAR